VRRAALLLLLASPPLLSEPTDAVLVVRFVGEEPEGTLGLSGPALLAPLTRSLGGWRELVLPGLPPGRYVLSLERAAGTTTTDLALGPQERLVVLVEGDKVTVEGTRVGRVIGGEDLRELPAGSTATALVETLDGPTIVDRVDDGGLSVGDPVHLEAHGSSSSDAAYAVGSADLTGGLGTGTPLVTLDRDAYESVGILETALPVEWGAGGPNLALRPRAGGPAWAGDVAGTVSPTESPSTASPPPIAQMLSLSEGSVSLGGPLVPERLTAFVHGSLSHIRSIEEGDSFSMPGERASLLARVSAEPGGSTGLVFTGAYESALRPFPGRDRFLDRDVLERDHGGFVSVEARTRGASSLLSLAASLSFGDRHPSGAVPAGAGSIDSVTDGPVAAALGASQGSETHWTVSARWDGSAGSGNRLTLGAEAGGSSATLSGVGSESPVGELVDGIPARAWVYGFPGTARPSLSRLALYAGDELRLGRLVLEGGLRFEHWSGGEEGSAVDWNRVLPRIQASYALHPGLRAFGSYGLYGRRLTLDTLLVGDPMGPQGTVYLWKDPNHNGVVDPGELGPLLSVVGPGSATPGTSSIAPGLLEPKTDEVVVGLDWRPGGSRIVLSGNRRRAADLLGLANVGVPASDYAVSYVEDPGSDFVGGTTVQQLPIYSRDPSSFGQDRYLLENAPGLTVLSEGVELEVTTPVTARFLLRISGAVYKASGTGVNPGYQVGENDPGILGQILVDPNAATFAYGRLFSDRAETLKVAGTFRAPWDLLFSGIARYQDGQPFARLVIAPGLPQGAEAVMAFARGLSRFHDLLTVDLRAEKTLRLGGVRPSVLVQVMNAFGSSGEIEEDVVTEPTYRRTTAVYSPREFLLGLRLAF
jgi:hypothetical protein